MASIWIASAPDDIELVTVLADSLEGRGHDVEHAGTLRVGDSRVESALRALEAGSHVVVCATAQAVGSRWCRSVVNAARVRGHGRVYVVQMEGDADVDLLSFGTVTAEYHLDPNRALARLADAIEAQEAIRYSVDAIGRASSSVVVTSAGTDAVRLATEEVAKSVLDEFQLRSVIVVEAATGLQLYRNLGRGGAAYFAQHVQPNHRVGLADATTTFSVVTELEPFSLPMSAFPISHSLDPKMNSVRSTFASLLELWRLNPECTPYSMPVPAFFASPAERTASESRPDVKSLLRQVRNVNLAVYSCGTFGPGSSYDIVHSFLATALEVDFDPHQLEDAGACGEINFHPYTIDGEVLSHPVADAIGYVTLHDLKRLAALSDRHMLMAAGGPHKVRPIVGALRGRLLNALVIDSATLHAVAAELGCPT